VERIISLRYGSALPFSDDADVFLLTVAKLFRQNLANRGDLPHRDDVLDRLAVWAERWAHSIPTDYLPKIVARAMRQPALERADRLAALLHLTYADRQYLKITTIGACDVSRAQRQILSKQKKRQRDKIRAAEKRRIAGKQTRSEYRATSLTATRPWEISGVSRRTWEREQKKLKSAASPSPTNAGKTV
jgi:hypothetical protein